MFQDNNLDISIELLGNGGSFIPGRKQIKNLVTIHEKDIKIVTIINEEVEEISFGKREINGISFKIRQIWKIWQMIIIALVIGWVVPLAGKYVLYYGVDLNTWITGLASSVIMFLLLLFLGRAPKLVIKFTSGNWIELPINHKADATDLLENLEYSSFELDKLKRISRSNLSKPVNLSKKTHYWKKKILLAIMGIVLTVGFSAFSMWFLNFYVTKYEVMYGWEFKNKEELNLHNVLDSAWVELGQWNTDIYEDGNERYIGVSYETKESHVLFRIEEQANEYVLRITSMNIHGEHVRSEEEAWEYMEKIIKEYEELYL